jgi:hypothetical protein
MAPDESRIHGSSGVETELDEINEGAGGGSMVLMIRRPQSKEA